MAVIKKSISLESEYVEFIELFDGENFSEKVREMIRSYETLGKMIKGFAKGKLKEDEDSVSIHMGDEREPASIQRKYFKEIIEFRKALERFMDEKSSWDFVDLLLNRKDEIFKY